MKTLLSLLLLALLSLGAHAQVNKVKLTEAVKKSVIKRPPINDDGPGEDGPRNPFQIP